MPTGIAVAAVTVLVAALMVLKHEFQSTAFADNSPEEAESVAIVDQPGTAALPLRSQSELMGGFSSVSNRAAAVESDENLFVRIYDVRNLVAPIQNSTESRGGVRRSPNSLLPSSRELAQWVMDSTAPPARWFEVDGEGGRLNFNNQLLIVRQSWRAHLAISDLLEQLAERIELPHAE